MVYARDTETPQPQQADTFSLGGVSRGAVFGPIGTAHTRNVSRGADFSGNGSVGSTAKKH